MDILYSSFLAIGCITQSDESSTLLKWVSINYMVTLISSEHSNDTWYLCALL